jgi:SAM-dependent methyltransferase
MKPSETQLCPLCGGGLGAVALEITQPDKYERAAGISEVAYLRRWIECIDCGALCDIHLSPEASKLEKWAANYYEVELAPESLAQKFQRIMALPPSESDNRQRVARVHDFMRRWSTTINEGSVAEQRVVDIGAGMGVFLAAFLESGKWRGLAVEPSPVAAAHLKGLRLFDVHEGFFNESLGLAGYDLITFNKVMEHIRAPHEVLRAARSAVAPSGILYVEVPHRLSAECHPPHHFILGALHHHLYSISALTKLLERVGWAPIETGTVFDPSGKISAFAFACLPETAIALGKRKCP